MENDFQQRLQRLEDELALRNHIDKYHWLADTFQWQAWGELFSEDTVFEIANANQVYTGRESTLKHLSHGIVSRYSACQHAIVNLRFEFEDDGSARGYGNLMFTGVHKKSDVGKCYASGGRYRWHFVKQGARWQTKHTKLEFVWGLSDTAAANMFKKPA